MNHIYIERERERERERHVCANMQVPKNMSYVCACTHIYIHIYVCKLHMYICKYIQTCTCIKKYVRLCMYVCAYELSCVAHSLHHSWSHACVNASQLDMHQLAGKVNVPFPMDTLEGHFLLGAPKPLPVTRGIHEFATACDRVTKQCTRRMCSSCVWRRGPRSRDDRDSSLGLWQWIVAGPPISITFNKRWA